MKLEFLALDNSVERLVRRVPSPKKLKIDKKGKSKEHSGQKSKKALAEMVLGKGTWPDGTVMGGSSNASSSRILTDGLSSLEESEDEDHAELGGKVGLKVETVDGIRFCDIVGVRIFEKEILGGRL